MVRNGVEQLVERFRRNPQDKNSYASLKSHYQDRGDLAALVKLIAVWAENAKRDTQASKAYVEAADLALRGLKDADRAAALYAKAVQRSPLDQEVFERLASLLESRGEHRKLLRFLDGHIQRLGSKGADPTVLARLHCRLGEIWKQHMRRPDRALSEYVHALELDNSLVTAIYEAREIHLEAGHLDKAAELYALEAKAEANPERKTLLLKELARVRADSLGDVEGAISALKNALSVQPEDTETKHQLAAHLLALADAKDKTDADEMRGQAADLLFEIAQSVSESHSLEFLEAALGVVPSHESALARLEQLAKKLGRTELLPPYWVAYLGSAPASKRAHQRRVRLAEAYEAAGQIEDAIYCLRPAADRGHRPSAALLRRLEGRLEAQPALQEAGSGRGELDTQRIVPLQPEAGPRAGEPVVARKRKSKARTAASSETPRAELSSAPPMTHSRAPEVEQRADDMRASRRSAPAPRDSAPAPTAVSELTRLRGEMREAVAARNHAVAAARSHSVLELDPTDAQAFGYLERYLLGTRDYEKLRDLLTATARTAELPLKVRRQRLREAADVSQNKLRDLDGAAQIWTEVVSLDPQDESARNSLKQVLERARRWDDLVSVLDRELASADEPERQAQLLVQLVRIHRDKRRDLGETALALEQLRELRPEDREIRDALCDSLLKLENYQQALPLLEERIEDCVDERAKVRLLRTFVKVSQDKLGYADQAYEGCRRILEIIRDDRDALARMQRIDEQAGRFDRLLEVLQRSAGALPRGEKAAALVRMAVISDEKLSDLDRAVGFLHQALALAPSNAEILEALCGVLQRAERYQDLLELLEKRLAAERIQGRRVELYRRIAHLHSDFLKDEDGAAKAWRSLLAIKEDAEALHFVRSLAIAQNDHEQLADALKRLAAIETDEVERRDLLFAYANVLTEELGRGEEAIPILQQIVKQLDSGFEPALDRLVQVSEAVGDHSSLAHALEMQLANQYEPAERVALARRLVDIYQRELKDADRAVVALQSWADADAEDPEPHRRLQKLYTGGRRWDALIATLDRLAELEPESEDQIQAVVSAAHVASDRLDDVEGAWARLAPLVPLRAEQADRAIHRLARKTRRTEELCQLLEEAERHGDLVALLRESAAEATDPEQRVELHRRIARVMTEALEDEKGAAAAWRDLLEIREDAEALDFMRWQAVRRDDPEQLADALRRLAAITSDATERRDLLFDYASVLHGRLQRPGDAIAVLKQIVEQLDPGFVPAIEELIAVSEAVGDHASLADALQMQLAVEPQADLRAAIAERLGDVCEKELKDPERAMLAFQQWAEADASNTQPHRRRLKLQEKLRQWEDALVTLDRLAELEPEREAQIEAVVHASEVAFRRLEDVDGAWDRLSPLVPLVSERVDKAIREVATQADRMRELCDLLDDAARHEDLVELLHERIAAQRKPERRVELYRRIARVSSDYLDDEDSATQAWQSLLDIVEDAEALRFMRQLAVRQDDPEKLGDALKRLAAIETDRGECRDLLFEYALVLYKRLERPEDAIGVLKQIVHDVDTEYEPAIEELIAISESVGDHASLADAMERQLALAPEAEVRADIAQRLADVCQRDLRDAERAIRALQQWAMADAADPEPHRRLRELHEDAAQWEPLLTTLDKLRELEPEAGAQIEATISAAGVAFEKLGDVEGAWTRLSPLVWRGIEDADVAICELARKADRMVELCQVLDDAERYERLLDVLRERVETEKDEDVQVEIWRRIASVMTDRFQDEDGAAEAWNRLLAIRQDPEALAYARWRAAKDDDAEQLAEVLRQMVEIEAHPEERRDLLFERARLLHDRLGRSREAIGVLQKVLELDPSFHPAVEELVIVCEMANDHARLAEALERQLATEPQPAARCAVAQRLADLYETDLKDIDRAIDALREWTEADAHDPEPQRRLRHLLTQQENWEDLLLTLSTLEALEIDPEVRAEATVSAATLAFEKFGDVDGAWDRLVPLVQQGCAEADASITQLARRTGRLKALSELFEKAEKYAELIEILRERSETEKTAKARVALYRQMARLMQEQLNDEEGARGVWEDLLQIKDDAEALRFVRQWASRENDYEKLGEALRRLAAVVDDLGERRDLLFQYAELLHTQLGRSQEAVKVLQQIIRKLDPRFAPALEELVSICDELGDSDSLADALERQLAIEPDAETRAAVAQRLAGICESNPKDRARTIRALWSWAQSERDNPEPYRRLRGHLENAKRWKDLLPTLDALGTLEPESEAQAEAVLAAADIAVAKLKDVDGAWRRLLPLFRKGVKAAEEALRRLARTAKREAALAAAYVDMAQQARDAEEQAAHWAAAASIYEEYLQQPAQALEAALRMLATNMDDRSYLDTVDRVAIKAKAWPRLGQVYDRLIKKAVQPEERKELLLRHAEILDTHADQPSAALDCITMACSLDPENRELLAQAEKAARRANSAAALLWIFNRRRSLAGSDEEQAQWLLKAAQIADEMMRDREQAAEYLRQALAAAKSSPEWTERVERTARSFDKDRPNLGEQHACRILAKYYRKAAKSEASDVAAQLLLRASKLLCDGLKDYEGAFDVLREGMGLLPTRQDIYEATEEVAAKIARLDAVDAQLSRQLDREPDRKTSLVLLQRRGRLLEERLNRFSDAADVYARLLVLDPESADAMEAVMRCLRKANRFRDLARLLARKARQTEDAQQKLKLLKEVANIWETELRDRWEALDFWKQVVELSPEDKQAVRAVSRLGRGSLPPPRVTTTGDG